MPIITVKLGDSLVQKFFFDKDVFSIGRAKDNDIVIETLSVSRNHARIQRQGDHYVLADLQSANGTHVNGVKVSRVEIMDDDVISIGKHKLYFSLKPADEEQALGEVFDAERTMQIPPAPVGVLLVTRGRQKNQEFAIDRYETLIGRAEDCQVRLHDWFVGRRHAIVHREGQEFSIKDLGKLAGVSVNGQAVRDRRALREGDEIKLGPVSMSFHIRFGPPPGEPAGRQPVEIGYPEPAPPSAKEAPEEARPVASRLEPEPEAPSQPFSAAEPEEAAEMAPALGPVQLPEGEAAARATPESQAAALRQAAPAEESAALEEAPAEAQSGLQIPSVQIPMGEPVAITESLAAEAALAEADRPLEEPPLELADVSPEELAPAASVAPESPPAPEAAAPAPLQPQEAVQAQAPKGDPAEIALWEKALQNPSFVIRREAAKTLKKLTGREYDA